MNKHRISIRRIVVMSLVFACVGALVTTGVSARIVLYRASTGEPVRAISKYILHPAETRLMTVTAYDKKSSCHYPKGDGCLTASGKIAKDSIAACPRDWEFGTKLYIGEKIYTCEDRYAARLSPRIDIWMENGALGHGTKKEVVRIGYWGKNRF